MDQKQILGTLFAILIATILFTQQGSGKWKIFLFFGIIIGAFWFFKK